MRHLVGKRIINKIIYCGASGHCSRSNSPMQFRWHTKQYLSTVRLCRGDTSAFATCEVIIYRALKIRTDLIYCCTLIGNKGTMQPLYLTEKAIILIAEFYRTGVTFVFRCGLWSNKVSLPLTNSTLDPDVFPL